MVTRQKTTLDGYSTEHIIKWLIDKTKPLNGYSTEDNINCLLDSTQH